MEGTNASGEVFCTSPKGKVEFEKTSGWCHPSDIGAVHPALVNGGEFPGSKAKNPDQKKRVPFGLTQKESGFRGYTLPHRNVGPVNPNKGGKQASEVDMARSGVAKAVATVAVLKSGDVGAEDDTRSGAKAHRNAATGSDLHGMGPRSLPAGVDTGPAPHERGFRSSPASKTISPDAVSNVTESKCPVLGYLRDGAAEGGLKPVTEFSGKHTEQIDTQALEVGSHKSFIALASSAVEASGTHMSGSGNGSPVPVYGIVCSQELGGAGLHLKGSGYDTPDPIVGGKDDRLVDDVVGVCKMVPVTTRMETDLPMPILRGKDSDSDPLYGLDNVADQDAEVGYGFIGSPIDRNVYNGLPLPVNGDLRHFEQNGQNVAEMETAQKGISVVRNRGNSDIGIMGNSGNNVDRNVDLSPVNSWKNFFSVPKKTNGQLRYSKPHRTDGKIMVKPPEEAVMEGIDMWKGCLVDQFLDKRLPFPVVRSLVNKLWGKKEMPDISTTENGLYFFRFRDLDARDWVMTSGPWHLAGRPFILRAWRPGMDMLNIQLTSIPIWVKFFNIPLEYWTNTSLGHIASVVGNPLHLDTLTENQSMLSFARICIEVGVDCEFPKSVLLDMGNGKYSTIRIEYPRAPQCCSNCKLFGHNLAHCHLMKKQADSAKETEEGAIMAGERRDTQVTGASSEKESPSVMGVVNSDIVADSIIKSQGTAKRGPVETNIKTHGSDVQHKLPGNTFECLAQSEEECPSEVAKNLDVVGADFSDTSPTLHTFKHVKRIDELDFTPVPLSKKKLKKLKKQNQIAKQASDIGGSNLLSNG